MGRLFGMVWSDCKGGKSCGKSGATTCQRCSALTMPFNRCSPMSRKVTLSGSCPRTSSALTLESKTCPPCAVDITRFTLQTALGLQRGVERIARSIEGRAKRVTNDLKDLPMVRGDRFVQDGVMT